MNVLSLSIYPNNRNKKQDFNQKILHFFFFLIYKTQQEQKNKNVNNFFSLIDNEITF